MGDLHTLRHAVDIDTEESAKTDLLEHMLLQLKIMNLHLSTLTGEVFTHDDIEEHE